MNSNNSELRDRKRRGFGIVSLILICIGMMLCGLVIVSMAQLYLQQTGVSQRAVLLTVSALQGALAFILPAWATIWFSGRSPIYYCGLEKSPGGLAYLYIGILMIISLPAMNQIIAWNAELHLPESMSNLENTLREFEDAAAETSAELLSTDSFWGMIVGVLIIGALTGFAEEFFFRGLIQNYLARRLKSPHVAIWVAAILFSALHFQFFGFVPRMLLGAFFGYLFYWSGSLWLAVFSHALNNSIVVVWSWLQEKEILVEDAESFGIEDFGGFPWLVVLSVIAFSFGLWLFRKWIFNSRATVNDKLKM